MRLLIAVAAAAAAAAPTEDDAAAATCLLAPNATCDADAPCGARAYSRSCLRLRVPWQTPYERVRCCLRCCLLHWVGALGLRDNFDRNKIPGARADEMLLGFGLESTMGFAALRKPLDATGGADGLNRADLWAPEVAAPGGVAAWRASSWVDVAFGDGCGGFAGYSFGAARRRHLEQLVEILNGRKLALVSTDDCDAPGSPAADRVLRHPNLAAWFVSNPKTSSNASKLRAFPIGARTRKTFVAALERAEAANEARRRLLMCCCMAALPPPGADPRAYPGLAAPASFNGMKPDVRAKLTNDTLLLGSGPDGLAALQKSVHASVAQVLKRVRRAAVVDALKRSGFEGCSYGAQRSKRGEERDAHADYVSQMRRAKFVASPQGNGRACHRDWEVLAAGAVPLVDWDASIHMARLYDGLPVVRVRDWRAVTPAALEAEWRRLDGRRGDLDVAKLYLPYWLAELTAHAFPGEAG